MGKVGNYYVVAREGDDLNQLSVGFEKYADAKRFLDGEDRKRYPHPYIVQEIIEPPLSPSPTMTRDDVRIFAKQFLRNMAEDPSMTPVEDMLVKFYCDLEGIEPSRSPSPQTEKQQTPDEEKFKWFTIGVTLSECDVALAPENLAESVLEHYRKLFDEIIVDF